MCGVCVCVHVCVNVCVCIWGGGIRGHTHTSSQVSGEFKNSGGYPQIQKSLVKQSRGSMHAIGVPSGVIREFYFFPSNRRKSYLLCNFLLHIFGLLIAMFLGTSSSSSSSRQVQATNEVYCRTFCAMCCMLCQCSIKSNYVQVKTS